MRLCEFHDVFHVVFELLPAFPRGTAGEVDEHDRHEKKLGLQHGFRLLSVYGLKNGTKIWIITEAPRSATTILRYGIAEQNHE